MSTVNTYPCARALATIENADMELPPSEKTSSCTLTCARFLIVARYVIEQDQFVVMCHCARA